MIWQWAVIAVGVMLAVVYLVGVIRRTIKRPFCSDCVGCGKKGLGSGA